jgi:UDP-2,3-diacylglucosamine hydrolase
VLQPGKKIYFASDFHLGVPNKEESLRREKKIVEWLDMASKDAQEVFLVGDVFDFWYEYKRAIPKGYVRIQGKIAELTDAGIQVHYFIGNHDMWAFNYFEEELGVKMYRQDYVDFEWSGKKFRIGHGDGLGPGDHGYKFIKKVFANPFLQWLFGWIHPNIGIGIANFWSGRSRMANAGEDQKFLGEENEWLAAYCRDVLKNNHYDYFIFGHRHLPLDIQVGKNSRYINLGEWVNYSSFAVFDGKELVLKDF